MLGRIFNYFKRENERATRLEALFQKGNRVRNLKSGKEFTVAKVDCGCVLLKSDKGHLSLLDLLTGAHTLRTSIADNWELAPLL